MRPIVVPLVLSLGLAGIASAQSLSEYGAAAAGGATGVAAGKKVSQGITAIFGKVDKQAADAAKQAKSADAKPPTAPEPPPPPAAPAVPAITSATPVSAANLPSPPKPAVKTLRKRAANPDQNIALGTPKGIAKSSKDDGYSLVPPPPPLSRVVIGRPVETSARLVAQAPPPAAVPAPPVVIPPPPPVTAEDLRRLTPGANREDVLKLGTFASHITAIDDGHLAETFRYAANDSTFGIVRVNDGVVAAVELR